MSGFWSDLARFARAGETVAVATVVAARGSTPRGVGARMIVRANGDIVGSVGGGCGEARVFWEAARVLAEGGARLAEVDLTGELSDESATHCGGIMEVLVDRASWEGDQGCGLSYRQVVEAVEHAAAARATLAVATVVADTAGPGGLPAGSKWLVGADGSCRGRGPAGFAAALGDAGAAAIARGGGHRLWLASSAGGWRTDPERRGLGLFLDIVPPPPALIVVGAGHIGQPVAEIGRLLDFHVTVVDDRPAFANPERFPGADRLATGDVATTLAGLTIDASTWIVLVTRGHQHDEAALQAVIGSDAAYVGMIGSRRRVREVFRHLSDAGVPKERLARVRAPIGLAIGAETPAEIAVAIAAELVQARRRAAAPAAPRARAG